MTHSQTPIPNRLPGRLILVWSSKTVNTKKGNRLPHEAGQKLLKVPRSPKELPVSALIRNAHSIPEWKLFVEE